MAAETALRIAPEWSRTHARLARLYAAALDWDAALREVEVVEAMDPNDPATLGARGNLNYEVGRWQEVIGAARLAIQCDPMNPVHYGLLASALYASGQYREAVRAWREPLSFAPRWPVHSQIAWSLVRDRRPEEALSEAEQETNDGDRSIALAMVYHALGRHDESDRVLAKAEQTSSVSLVGVAVVHAFRGETDLAFHWLDRAVAERDKELFVIKGNVGVFPNISSDPRYAVILRSIGLPP